MGINLSTSSPMYYASIFGCDPSLLTQAANSGVSIQSNTSALVFVVGGAPVAHYAIKAGPLALAKAGSMGPSSKLAHAKQIEQCLMNAIGTGGKPTPLDTSGMTAGQKAAVTKVQNTMQKLAGGVSINLNPIKKNPFTAPIPEQVFNQPPSTSFGSAVPLSVANAIFQPVIGTSPGSTYFVVGLLAGLKVAIRRTKTKLSIRAEGAKLKGCSDALESMGMVVKSDYASVHLAIDAHDSALTRKALGALYGAACELPLLDSVDPMKVSLAE